MLGWISKLVDIFIIQWIEATINITEESNMPSHRPARSPKPLHPLPISHTYVSGAARTNHRRAQRSSCVWISSYVNECDGRTTWSPRYQQGNCDNGSTSWKARCAGDHLRVGDLSATCTYKDGIEDNGEEVKKRANTWTAIVASNVSPWAGVHEDFSAWPGEPGLACKSAPVSNALSWRWYGFWS
jgi:hypothetical protein